MTKNNNALSVIIVIRLKICEKIDVITKLLYKNMIFVA